MIPARHGRVFVESNKRKKVAKQMSMYELSVSDPKANDVYRTAYDKHVSENGPIGVNRHRGVQVNEADKAGRRAARRYAREMGITLTD